MRHYSLDDLRTEISTELRNPATNSRYSTAELDVAIQRSARTLREYFFIEQVDDSQSFTNNTFSYDYDYPVRDIFRVELIETSSTPHHIPNDWQELTKTDGCTLYFGGNQGGSPVIRLWYELHPFPYPSDIAVNDGTDVADDDLTIIVDGGTALDWPQWGYLKIDDEYMNFTALDRSTLTLTVVRGQLDSAAATHLDDATVSFVNEIEKPTYIEGVKELSIKFLNRMRIVDASSGDIAGNVTIMREIDDGMRQWVRDHRMRTKRPGPAKTNRSVPMRGRRRGK